MAFTNILCHIAGSNPTADARSGAAFLRHCGRKNAWAALSALALTACATAPAHLTAAKAAVDGRTEYVYYKGWKKPAGLTENQGNCTVFSIRYAFELREMGYAAGLPTLCQVPGGEWHSVLDVDGYRLDNREDAVIPVWASDCTNNKKAFRYE